MAKKRKLVRLYVDAQEDPDGTRPCVWAEWTTTKTDVQIPINLAESFIRSSERGVPWECLLAEAIKQGKTRFPHSVIYPHVIGTIVYIVTRRPSRPGQFHRAIRFEHNFTKTLRKFDTYSTDQFVAEFGDRAVEVRLTEPRKHGQPGVRGVADPTGAGNGPAAHSTSQTSRGSLRRAIAAGLMPPGTIPMPIPMAVQPTAPAAP